jgi:hypothetical protein
LPLRRGLLLAVAWSGGFGSTVTFTEAVLFARRSIQTGFVEESEESGNVTEI